MIQIIGTIFVAALGLAFGSFLNVCLSRWPAEESVVQPRSHCRNCSHTLSWWENVPLVSWLVLQGRCRECRSWIGWRYPLVEFLVAGLWSYTAWRSYNAFIPIEYAAGMMIFWWILVALAFLDAEHLWLPNFLTFPGIALGFGWWVLQGQQIGWGLHIPPTPWEDAEDAGERLFGILVAAGIILLIRWIYWLVRRQEGMGLGDAKLMALLAAWLGLPQALFAFGVGVMIGGGAALVLLALPKVQSDAGGWALKKLPLGTFLCIGGVVSSLWGQRCIDAYLRWAGF